MAAKPLTTEAIAFTEKKMDMSLDDIIKMSKNGSKKNKKQRVPNKSQSVFRGNAGQRNAFKVQKYLDSRSSIRQGALAQRRSNFRGNQFPVTTEFAKKAAAPIRNRFFNNNRVANRNQNRVGPAPVQRKAFGRDTYVKEKAKLAPKQKPGTLDARFADLREQRIKIFCTEHIMPDRRWPTTISVWRNQFGKQ